MGQFAQLVQSQAELMDALATQHKAGSSKGKQPATDMPHHPKISVKIPVYKGEPKENVLVWLLQVQNLFNAQGINDERTKIYYAVTGFEEGALHWYLNKIQNAGDEFAF